MPVLQGQPSIDDGLTPVDRLLQRLEGVKQSGSRWYARCPVTCNHTHGDKTPSLSVAEGAEGRALVKCHKGCSFAEIMEAIDLPLTAAFPAPAHILEAPVAKPSQNGHKQIAASYNYVDENGVLLFQTIRYEPKDFRQRRPDEDGGWFWNLEGVRRVLYHLRDILSAPADQIVYVCEGEKDVENLRSLGLVATCNPLGAGKWDSAYSESLRDRYVVILEDNDEVGRKHAQEVAQSLTGVASLVKVVSLPNLPDKGDASDWIESGGTAKQLGALAINAPEWGEEPRKARFTIHSYAELHEVLEPPEAIIEGLMYRGTLTACTGDAGSGKTYFCLAKAVSIAAGLPFLGRPVKQGRVLIIDEESGHRRLHLRLNAILRGLNYEGPDLPIWWITSEGFNFNTLNDVREMEVVLADIKPDYVIVDALMEVTAGADENSTEKMVPALQKMHNWVQNLQMALDLIHHHNKRGSYRGSTGIKGVVDVLLNFEKEQGSDIVRIESDKNRDDPDFKLSAKMEFVKYPCQSVTFTEVDGGAFTAKLLPSEVWVKGFLHTHEPSTLTQIVENSQRYKFGTIKNACWHLLELKMLKRVDSGGQGVEATFAEVVS